jgi:hypothetical protein
MSLLTKFQEQGVLQAQGVCGGIQDTDSALGVLVLGLRAVGLTWVGRISKCTCVVCVNPKLR